MKDSSKKLGEDPVGRLLLKMALPATIGMLVMVVYNITDTIFVSKFVGSYAVGGMSVVTPITMLISAIGMSIGIGAGAVLSRRLGAGDTRGANKVFGNMVLLGGLAMLLPSLICYLFDDFMLRLFGADGALLPFAKSYYTIVMYGAPVLGFAMMFNNTLRSEGKAKETMLTMFLSALVNIGLDWYLILELEMGIEGAALATVASQIISLFYVLGIYLSKQSVIDFNVNRFRLDLGEVKEITAIGMSSLARQGSFSVLAIVVNHSLLVYGGTFGVAVYGVVNRIVMMAVFPMFGIAQGLMPIVSYNLGAKLYDRVSAVFTKAVLGATLISSVLFTLLFFKTSSVMSCFTNDSQMLEEGAFVLRTIVILLPAVGVQILGSVYFQAIGKARPALVLTLSRQLFLLVPLIVVLPVFYGVNGVWYAFPLADMASTILTLVVLMPSLKSMKVLGENT